MQRSWHLLGRERELRHIAAVRADGAGGVVIVGKAGLGKTRLASEALALADGAGDATARLAATRAAASIPFGALSAVLPELREGTNPLYAARREFKTFAAGRPLVLMVDDAHLLDGVSATLILQLAVTRDAFIIATVRGGEIAPEPVVQLWKDGHADRIDLAPLGERDVDALVGAILGGAVDPELLATVRRLAQGNPLIVRELLLSAQDDGSVRSERGVWHAVGGVAVSGRLTELVEQRIGNLDADERNALELVAQGEPLGLSMLERLSSSAVMERLELRGLLDVRMDGLRTEVWLAHPLHGEAVRAKMPPRRRRAILALLAEAVEQAGARRRGDLLRVTGWKVEAGVSCDAARLIEASVQTVRAMSWDAAAKLGRAAWSADPTWQTGMLLGLVLLRIGRYEEADTVLAATGQLAADDVQRVDVAGRRAEALHRGLARPEQARQVVADARGVVTDVDALAELAVADATIDLYEGGSRSAIEAVAPLLDGPPSGAFLGASFVSAFGLAFDGRTDTAQRHATAALELHRAVWDRDVLHDPPSVHVIALAQGLIEAGAFVEADRIVAEEEQQAVRRGDQLTAGLCAWTSGRLRLAEGRVASAARLLRHAADHWIGTIGQRLPLSELVIALSLVGDLAGARAAAERCYVIPSRCADGWLLEGEAWMATAIGDFAAARARLDEGADEWMDGGQRAVASRLLHDMARLGDPHGALARLRRIARSTESPLIGARSAHVAALAADDGAALEDVVVTFEGMGARLLAAEAAAAAAQALRRVGEHRRATALAHRASQLLADCEGATTPGVAQLQGASPLTTREHEIAVMAAAGLTSKMIASRLFLSNRTIENHLQRVYAKLGIPGRRQLADALGIEAGAEPYGGEIPPRSW
jgi:DNA-binding CsgD family transcriptional regulator